MNEHPHRQIMGTETEWNVGVKRLGEPNFQALGSGNGVFYNADIIKDDIPDGIKKKNSFLSNGARFYMDLNTHPEYATPENTSMKGLLVSELAGERILAHGLHRLLAHNERVAEVVAMKRVVDAYGVGTGYHLNMSEDRSFIKDIHEIHPLAWHYATSLPLLGGGMVERYSGREEGKGSVDKYRFSWGQKVLQIVDDFNNSTTRNRPFINTRDEPHANPEHYWRFHIIGNDPHILEWPAWMLFGTTSLVLAACRQGRMRKFQLASGEVLAPAAHIAQAARYDLSDDRKYELLVGGLTKKYTANEINMMILEDVDAVKGKTAEQEAVCEEWKAAAEDRARDVMLLSLRSDAVTKLASIRRKQAKRGDDSNDFQQEDLASDQKYTTIFRATRERALEMSAEQLYDSSPAALLRKKVTSPAVGIADDEIKKSVFQPPKTTRANLRGYFIKNQKELNLISTDWKYCKVANPIEGGKVEETKFIFDPFDGAVDR